MLPTTRNATWAKQSPPQKLSSLPAALAKRNLSPLSRRNSQNDGDGQGCEQRSEQRFQRHSNRTQALMKFLEVFFHVDSPPASNYAPLQRKTAYRDPCIFYYLYRITIFRESSASSHIARESNECIRSTRLRFADAQPFACSQCTGQRQLPKPRSQPDFRAR
jgi:hypothetical protein